MFNVNDPDWEYKIVRAEWNEFARREHLDTLLRQEATAGWVMAEKYDDQRVRLKRPIDAHYQDFYLPRSVDPYRTTYTIPLDQQVVALMFLAICLSVALLLIVLLALAATWPG
jgi:hypothetical protein